MLSLLGLGWLVPNHYAPWLTAWGDAVALLVASAAALMIRQGVRIPAPWLAFVTLSGLTVLYQCETGKIFFTGDAWMVCLYLFAFVVAIALGSTGRNGLDVQNSAWDLSVFGGILASAILSVAVALVQWTHVFPLGLFGIDMPRGGRPFGNVGQPNHLATICALGLISLAVLRQSGRVGLFPFWLVALWLLFGAVMTGSRTAWLQVALISGFIWVFSAKVSLRMNRVESIVLVAVFVSLSLTWPALNSWLLIDGQRPTSEVAASGTRLLHWSALLDAVQREPWTGYGWQQVGVAQVRLAADRPFVGEHIEHSHNVLLDLLLWNGIPMGLILISCAGYWFISRLLRLRNPLAAWSMLGILCVTVHGLLEYPLEYAYFLIPVGFLIGLVDADDRVAYRIPISPGCFRVLGLVLTFMLAVVADDYLRAEESYRQIRLESARIGAPGLTTPPPELRVLTNLQAFLDFIHTPAREGMSTEQVNHMRKVSERFAYPPALFRFALAAGLNGDPAAATLTLERICRMHPPPRCAEARTGWVAAVERFPKLAGVVIPEMPAN